jgi:hypothetical protein
MGWILPPSASIGRAGGLSPDCIQVSGTMPRRLQDSRVSWDSCTAQSLAGTGCKLCTVAPGTEFGSAACCSVTSDKSPLTLALH